MALATRRRQQLMRLSRNRIQQNFCDIWQDAELEWLEKKFGGIGETAPPTPDISADAWLRLQVPVVAL